MVIFPCRFQLLVVLVVDRIYLSVGVEACVFHTESDGGGNFFGEFLVETHKSRRDALRSVVGGSLLFEYMLAFGFREFEVCQITLADEGLVQRVLAARVVAFADAVAEVGAPVGGKILFVGEL